MTSLQNKTLFFTYNLLKSLNVYEKSVYDSLLSSDNDSDDSDDIFCFLIETISNNKVIFFDFKLCIEDIIKLNFKDYFSDFTHIKLKWNLDYPISFTPDYITIGNELLKIKPPNQKEQSEQKQYPEVNFKKRKRSETLVEDDFDL